MTELVRVLMQRDDLTQEEAEEMVQEAKERVIDGEDPEEVLLEELELEPDYIFDLLD